MPELTPCFGGPVVGCLPPAAHPYFEHFPGMGAQTAGVKSRLQLSAQVLALVERQGGVVSRDQLLRSGLPRPAVARMLTSGLLTRVTSGVYARGADPGWLGRAWAGLLIGGSTAVLGGTTAGYLEKLVREPPDVITAYSSRQLASRDGWLFIRGHRLARGEPARTRYEATVIDLCCSSRDEDALAALLSDAVSSRRTTAKRLLTEVDGRTRVRHRSLLRQVLCDVSQGAHSALERRFLVAVERAHELPTATRQAHARTKHRSDAYYEDFGLVVELDSKLHHRGSASFVDMSRDNDHALVGIVTLRFGWAHVTGSNDCSTAEVIAAALSSRGWTGPGRTCPHCELVHPV